MPRPVRSLPVVQNWDCHACGDCCRTYDVRVTPAEAARALAQKWDELAGTPAVVPDRVNGGTRLARRADGACVFLDESNRCRLHAARGGAAKPMACRLYPFVLTPAGDRWQPGIRFGCPSALDNLGPPAESHRADLKEAAKRLELEAPPGSLDRVPPVRTGLQLPWPQLHTLTAATVKLLANPATPTHVNLLAVLAFSQIVRPAKLDQLPGDRLDEFLGIVGPAAAAEAPDVSAVRPPGWVGRVIFRQLAGVYARKDFGPDRGDMASRGPFGRAAAGWRFARGTGTVPRTHARIPAVSFAAADATRFPLPAESEALLARYYRVKAESMQFFGPTNFGLGFWDGLDSLILTYPVIRWLARVLAAGGTAPAAAVRDAVRIVDDNFGYNPQLSARRQFWGQTMLNIKREMTPLVAWAAWA